MKRVTNEAYEMMHWMIEHLAHIISLRESQRGGPFHAASFYIKQAEEAYYESCRGIE